MLELDIVDADVEVYRTVLLPNPCVRHQLRHLTPRSYRAVCLTPLSMLLSVPSVIVVLVPSSILDRTLAKKRIEM